MELQGTYSYRESLNKWVVLLCWMALELKTKKCKW